MKRVEIINVYRTLKRFPKKEEFLKSLYPDAFHEEDVTGNCNVARVNPRAHSSCANFEILYGKERVGVIVFKNVAQPERPYEGNMQPGTIEYVKTISLKSEFGFRIEFSKEHSGLRVYKLGKAEDEGSE